MQEEPSTVVIGLKPCALQRMRGGSYLKFYLIHQIAGPVRDAAIDRGLWVPLLSETGPFFYAFLLESIFGPVGLQLRSVWTRYHARVSIVNAVHGLFFAKK